MVDALVGFSAKYEEHQKATESWEVISFKLTMIWVVIQTLMQAFLKDRAAGQGTLGSGVGFRESWLRKEREKGKGKTPEEKGKREGEREGDRQGV
jgi:hypothetical protein